MDYCSVTDIKNAITHQTLVELTNDEGGSTVDTVVVEESILYGSILINGYLRGRYPLPLNTPFPLLRLLAIDLAIYRLYFRRMHTDMPESIANQYKNAIKTLTDIQKGIITLDIPEINTSLKTGQYKTNKTPANKDFSPEVMKGF